MKLLAMLLVALSGVSAFMAPVPNGGRLEMRTTKGWPARRMQCQTQRKATTVGLKMQGEPSPEDIEKKYIQQNSGVGYRKNSQDGLLFAMGAAILLIPFVAVMIAIGTGYIPLDYVR